MYVCEARLTMATRALPEFIENKLKSALIFDPDTGQPFVAIEDQVSEISCEFDMMIYMQNKIFGYTFF